ncbi:MAG: mechanosensitive ion channel family protein [Syntrophomonadaceae bacterium]|nr:mechanosensitive ion channel family protein [Syntrophomonadaceae bacterium]
MVAQWYQGYDCVTVVNNPLFYSVGVPLLIVAGFWILEYVICRLLKSYIAKRKTPERSNPNEQLLSAIIRPVRFLILVLGIYTALMYMPLAADTDFFISRFFRSLLIIIVAWGAGNIAAAESFLSSEFKDRLRLDKILVAFFLKVIKFVIIALAIVLIAHEWNYDVNGFIAGLGLGGLAFALAAKDALANIFGGIVIIMEKPFSIGDWVQTPDVDGTVEEISFRSTRFRTAAQALVTVPNSNLSNKPITNLSRMGKRYARFTLRIDYAGPKAKIEQFLRQIRAMLKQNPAVHPQTIMVYLENINVNSLDILINFYTHATNYEEYLKVREDINYQIMDIMAENKLALAAPGRLIYSQPAPAEIVVIKESDQ